MEEIENSPDGGFAALDDLMSRPDEEWQKGAPGTENLKIMVVSTPKMGHAWLEHLFSEIYKVPIVEAPATAGPGLAELGQRWVSHQHYLPDSSLLELAQQFGIRFVTILRHPADALVSLFHFRRNLDPNIPIHPEDPSVFLIEDGDHMGQRTVDYVRDRFYESLNISVRWLSSACPVVRYEDLICDPVATMWHATRSIAPASLERIKNAVALCSVDMLRRMAEPIDKCHYRSGKAGEWTKTLPAEIVQILRGQNPYPAQFRALGYSLEPATVKASFSYESVNPFYGRPAFDNGVGVCPVLVRLYLDLMPLSCRLWPNPTATDSEDSFCAWLNKPAGRVAESREMPTVTNLAFWIYQYRADLRRVFPDISGKNRLDFCNWFAYRARPEYDLDPFFFIPAFVSMAQCNPHENR